MANLNFVWSDVKWPWRNKPQVSPEVMGLLNLLDEAAVLVEKEQGIIQHVNTAFLRLTAYDEREVNGKPLATLVSEFSPTLATVQEIIEGNLQRRMREPIGVGMRIRLLDPTSPFLVATFRPNYMVPVEMSEKMQAISDFLIHMAGLTCGDGKLCDNLQSAVERVTAILGAGAVCIYQANPQQPRLDRLVTDGQIKCFPETIPSSDLVRLAKTTIWRPGKRVQVEIHRVGRINGLEYVASIPLGQPGRWVGLLVAADTGHPIDRIEMMLEVFGAQFTRQLEQDLLITNLQECYAESQQALTVWRGMVDGAQEGMVLITPEMKVKTVNPAAEWMLGYAEREVKGQQVENVIIGPDNLLPVLTSAFEGIPTHDLGSVSLHRRNGQSFPAQIQIIPVGVENRVSGVAIFITDISENEESKTRTQQLEQRAVLGDVTAVFAHEVRNPINNIYSGLQLLASVLPEDDPNQENLNRLQHDCMRLNHLMESVLNFSRNSQYTFEEVDLQRLLKRIIDRWQPRFSKVNVQANYLPTNALTTVSGDSRALEQVFTNLIGNAVEAMSTEGGVLSVRLDRVIGPSKRPQIQVSVSDSGPGIPEEIRERIFEPFVTTKTQGTGLGLAITKRIVTAHHGSIQVTSFPGGTVFELKFPAHQHEDVK
jgi:two-component system, NtrC family, sensor histidine kinase AtoS